MISEVGWLSLCGAPPRGFCLAPRNLVVWVGEGGSGRLQYAVFFHAFSCVYFIFLILSLFLSILRALISAVVLLLLLVNVFRAARLFVTCLPVHALTLLAAVGHGLASSAHTEI